jgi:PKD repeat protein
LGFGLVAVGSNVQASFVVTNQGGAALAGGAVSVSGGPFTILSGTPFNLAGFGTTNVVVRFAPTNTAVFTNLVAFTTGNGGNSTNQLTGSAALPPTASFTGNPTSGLVPLSVSFTNASTGAISNSIWDFGDGATTNTSAATLAHNYAGAGTNTVTLTVSSPLGTNTLTRTGYILVTNLPPLLALSPTNLDFGSVVLGQTNTQSFQLVNSGGLVLTGNVVTVPPFAIQSGNPFSLASGQTGQVSVSFSPTNAANFSNVVIFASNAGNRTNLLSGVGLTPARLAVSPATLDLGLVAVGTNVQAAFVVTNQGGAALNNGAASLNTGPFTILSGTPFTLSGFGATNLVVRFAPTNAGSFTNSAVFTTSNGGNATNLLTGSAAVAPSADFAANPTTGEWPLSVLFTDLSKGTITNSFWDFGDGATTNTTVSAFSHNYPGMGTNTVSLTVSGPLGTDTVTRPNYIVITNVPPVTLSILLVSNQVQLIWREGMLQYATGPTDTYTNLPAAISPYTITPAEATLFFRVKVR